MQINILDASTLGGDVDLSVFNELGELKIYNTTTSDEVEKHASGADVLVLNKVKINEETLPDSQNLKLICVTATGYDNISLDYCRKNGIALCNVKGYSTNSVAQLTISMALYLACHIKEYTAYVEDMSYTKSGVQNRLSPAYHELSGKKWGIIGCGAIGGKVAEVAKALGCEIAVYKRSPHSIYENMDIDTLMRECDIISVHTPLDETTKNLVNRDRIYSMKKEAIFINVARGAVADEAALCDAIGEGKIGGIGIDVYSTEPFPNDSPYTKIMHLPNVCLTPHMAWGAIESRERCVAEVCQNIKAFYNEDIRNRII